MRAGSPSEAHAALGAPPEIFTLWVVTASVHGICQHANMQMRIGPLNWVFSMAELHRWHHSRLVRESNTNYGCAIILWDRIFGTYSNGATTEIGTGPTEPSLWQKFQMPFVEPDDTATAPGA